MSTEETRSVVAGYVAALQRGDIDALRTSFTPKATWTIRGDIPVAGTWTGPDEILDGFLAQLTATLDPATPVTQDLHRITADVAPKLVATTGVGPAVASALLITAGDNPHRMQSEAAFAALCGSNPIPASSGKTNRHRLNRGGDRNANAALWRIVIVRLACDERTRKYLARRQAEGKTKTEAIRCLKRYVAREIFNAMPSTAAI